MYDTNYNRRIQSQILDNTKRHMMNIKALNGSGMKKGLVCENCGSVLTGAGHHHITFNDVMGDIKKDAGRCGELIVLGLVALTVAMTMLAQPSWMIHVVLFNLVVFAQGLVFIVKGQR